MEVVEFLCLCSQSTTANCEPESSQAQVCAILNTKLLVTSIGVPNTKVHTDVLKLLSDAFREEIFLEFIPELLTASYLGPDPEALILSSEAEDAVNAESGASKTLVAVFSLGCALLLLKVIFCIAFPKAPKVAYEKVMSHYRRKQRVPTPTCIDASEGECDEAPRGAPPSAVSVLQRLQKAPRRLRDGLSLPTRAVRGSGQCRVARYRRANPDPWHSDHPRATSPEKQLEDKDTCNADKGFSLADRSSIRGLHGHNSGSFSGGSSRGPIRVTHMPFTDAYGDKGWYTGEVASGSGPTDGGVELHYYDGRIQEHSWSNGLAGGGGDGSSSPGGSATKTKKTIHTSPGAPPVDPPPSHSPYGGGRGEAGDPR